MAKGLTERKKKWIEKTVDNDRRYKAIVYNRAFACIFFVLLQLAIFVTLLLLTDYGWIWQLVVGIVSVISVIYLEGREDRSPTKTLWIILLLIVPFVGLPLYLIYGDGKAVALMKRRYKHAGNKVPALPSGVAEEGRAGGVSRLLEKFGYPTYADGDVTYYPTGKECFEAMKESLRRAEKYVLIEYFILSGGKMWNELLKLLLEKAEAGVQVKIIYDDFGSIFCLPPHYARYLESLHKNVRCLAFNKVYPIFTARYNHRDHRKIFIVDGKEAFTGGLNIADEYIDEKKRFGYWKDTGIKITGSAVASMARTFFETWVAFKEPTLEVAPYLAAEPSKGGNALIASCADSPLDRLQVCERVYLEIINRARDYLYITTPYLVLDDLLREALVLAALRGVDVRIVTPGIPDKKAVYRLTRAHAEGLMKAGVRVYEYTPGFMHAKMTLSDGYAVVGSTNYDYRSLYLHFENMVYFRDEKATAAVAEDFEQLFLVSKECTPATMKRSFFGRLVDTVLRIFEPLL